jgi:ribosome-binding factor A
MEESKRQRQVGRLVQEEMSDIFLREGMNMVQGGMVSVSKVQMTPDLMEARVFLSFFQVERPEQLLHEIKERTGEWRKLLGARVGKQLRRVPELHFFADDTLDHVFRMEEIFKKIREEKSTRGDSADPNPPEA